VQRALTALLLLALAAGGAYYWHRHPPRIYRQPPESAARPPGSSGDGDVAILVVGPTGPGKPHAWTYAWANLVMQEFGPYALIGARSVSAGDLVGRRVVVVPAGVFAEVPPRGWLVLREFVERGGTMLVEAGLDDWASELGDSVEVALEPVPTGADTSAAWLALRPMLEGLWPADATWPPRAGRMGEGAVVVVPVPLARAAVDLQQAGAPLGGLARDFPGLRPSVQPQPTSFVVDTVLLDLKFPAFDGLEHQVGVALMSAAPLPRLWVAPAGASGAFLMTHDTELMGDRSLWMAEASAARGDPCTYFLQDTAFTAQGLARLDSLGVDTGFHWDRTPTSLVTRRIGRFRLYRRQRPGASQLGGLAAKGFEPGPAGLINRNHYLAMDSPARHFRQMAALGVSLDSSFGPDAAGFGYPFATQLPFHPLDVNGLPFQFLELPFQYADYFGDVDSTRILDMMRHTAQRDHGALVALYHPNFFSGRGEISAFVEWRRSPAWARGMGLWVGTMSGYLGFSRNRERAFFTSSWADPILQVETSVADSLQSVVVPLRWNARPLRSAKFGEQPVRWTETQRWGERLALVRLPRGRSELSFSYGPAR
jgi:hypothetical protein